MDIKINHVSQKEWDKEYPCLMEDVQNGDIVLVHSGEAFCWNGTKIYDGVFDEITSSCGRWVKRRLKHINAEIQLST